MLFLGIRFFKWGQVHAKFKNKFCKWHQLPCHSTLHIWWYSMSIHIFYKKSIYICGCQNLYIFPCIYHIITWETLEDKVTLFPTGPSGICLTSTSLVISYTPTPCFFKWNCFLILSCYFWLTAPQIGQSLCNILCSMTVRISFHLSWKRVH